MANNKSAQKRIDIMKRNRLENKFYKSSTRTLIKIFLKSINSFQNSQDLKQQEKSKQLLNSIYSMIDKGKKRKVFHRNTASRKKSRLTKYLRKL